MDDAFTIPETAALLELDERGVRKEIERGIFEPSVETPRRLILEQLVYLRALRSMKIELDVPSRKLIYERISSALRAHLSSITVDPVFELRVGPILDDVRDRIRSFRRWVDTRIVPQSLKSEPMLVDSRLLIRWIAEQARQQSVADIRESHPVLSSEDVEFARRFVMAYPKLGRPRTTPEWAENTRALELSERALQRIQELNESPPAPNPKMRAAAQKYMRRRKVK